MWLKQANTKYQSLFGYGLQYMLLKHCGFKCCFKNWSYCCGVYYL